MANSEEAATTDKTLGFNPSARERETRAYGVRLPMCPRNVVFMVLDLRLVYPLSVREDMERHSLNQQRMNIPIPEYRLREIHRHLSRIAAHASCDNADLRTVNALRLARKDLRTLEKYLTDKP